VQLGDPHLVDAVGACDFGMLAITNVAPKNTCAALPPHLIAGAPSRLSRNSFRRRAPGVALAGFARFAAG